MVVVLASLTVWAILCWRGTPWRSATAYVLRVNACLILVAALYFGAVWALGI